MPQGPRSSLDELRALQELKHLKELKEQLGNFCAERYQSHYNRNLATLP